MHHAGLHGGLRPGRLDRLGEPGEPVAADDQHVPDAAVGELGADPGPELRALGGLDPDPQDVLDAVHVDADGDVRGLVRARARRRGPSPPARRGRSPGRTPPAAGDCQALTSSRTSSVILRDRLVGQLGAERGGQVVLDVADRHPAGVQADDHLVQAARAPRALRAPAAGRTCRRGPAAWPGDVADLGAHRLRVEPLREFGDPLPGRVALLIAQVVGQLGLPARARATALISSGSSPPLPSARSRRGRSVPISSSKAPDDFRRPPCRPQRPSARPLPRRPPVKISVLSHSHNDPPIQMLTSSLTQSI